MPAKIRKSNSSSHARAVRSKQALRRALLKLLERKTFEQITVRDIAEAAKLDYTTFFRHQESKEALLNEIAAEEMQNLVSKTLPVFDTVDTRAACVALCAYVHQHRSLWRILLTGGAASALREELLHLSRLSAEIRSPRTSWLPADIGITLSVSGQFEILAWWLGQTNPLPVERVAEIMDRLLFAPLPMAQRKLRRAKTPPGIK